MASERVTLGLRGAAVVAAVVTVVVAVIIGVCISISFLPNPKRLLVDITNWSSPYGVAISPDGHYLYVGNGSPIGEDCSVSMIDTITGVIIGDISVGVDPTDLAVSPDGRRVYVTNDSNDILVIDTAINNVTTTIPTKTRSTHVAVSPDGGRVYVVASTDLLVIDAATNTVTTTIPTEYASYDVAVSPDGGHVYATNIDGGLLVIDTATNTVATTISAGTRPTNEKILSSRGVAVSPDGHYVYIANHVVRGSIYNPINSVIAHGSVSVIDTATNAIITTIPTEYESYDVAVSPDGRYVYAAVSGRKSTMKANFPGEISVIDTVTSAVTTTFILDGNNVDAGMVVSPDGRRIYVATSDSNSVTTIDAAALAHPPNYPPNSWPSEREEWVRRRHSAVVVGNTAVGHKGLLLELMEIFQNGRSYTRAPGPGSYTPQYTRLPSHHDLTTGSHKKDSGHQPPHGQEPLPFSSRSDTPQDQSTR